jgi:hypothetical protein
MAFSTASAPVESNIAFLEKSPGILWARRSASSTYGSEASSWKQVCVTRLSCAATAAITFGWQCPVLTTAIPPAKSM